MVPLALSVLKCLCADLMKSHLLSTAFVLVLHLLTGCFPADLPPLEAPPAVSGLTDLADASIELSVDTGSVQGHRGYQYLTALPVTRVYAPDTVKEVTDQLKVQAGLKGYRLVPPGTPSQKPEYRLDVTVQELNVSGYCYLLLRRPHSDVLLTATLRSKDGTIVRECDGSGDATFTAKFAFSEQLNEARRIALTQAAVALVECLALPKPRTSR